jgi:hypothetical protein
VLTNVSEERLALVFEVEVTQDGDVGCLYRGRFAIGDGEK